MEELVDVCAVGKCKSLYGQLDHYPVDIIYSSVGQFVFGFEVHPVVQGCGGLS